MPSVREKLEQDVNDKTVREILVERSKRVQAERKAEHNQRRTARFKALDEVRTKRDAALAKQRQERLGKAEDRGHEQIRVARRALTQALDALEVTRINKVTEEGREKHMQTQQLEAALAVLSRFRTPFVNPSDDNTES